MYITVLCLIKLICVQIDLSWGSQIYYKITSKCTKWMVLLICSFRLVFHNYLTSVEQYVLLILLHFTEDAKYRWKLSKKLKKLFVL